MIIECKHEANLAQLIKIAFGGLHRLRSVATWTPTKEKSKSTNCILYFLRPYRPAALHKLLLSVQWWDKANWCVWIILLNTNIVIGVGKTELCKALAAAYFGKEDSRGFWQDTYKKLIAAAPHLTDSCCTNSDTFETLDCCSHHLKRVYSKSNTATMTFSFHPFKDGRTCLLSLGLVSGSHDSFGHVRVHGAPHGVQVDWQPSGLCGLRRGKPADRWHPQKALQLLSRNLQVKQGPFIWERRIMYAVWVTGPDHATCSVASLRRYHVYIICLNWHVSLIRGSERPGPGRLQWHAMTKAWFSSMRWRRHILMSSTLCFKSWRTRLGWMVRPPGVSKGLFSATWFWGRSPYRLQRPCGFFQERTDHYEAWQQCQGRATWSLGH